MGKILRKRRVGKEESENIFLGKSDVQGLKTGSPPKTLKRAVLMDRTNALKPKDVRRNKAPNLKNAKNATEISENSEGTVARVTRRRRSSKENVKESVKSNHVQTESRPLGDKTNVAEAKNLLGGVAANEAADEKDVDSKEIEQAPIKETITTDAVSKSGSTECPLRKRPFRNASKFKEGWISALRSSRTSKESDKEQKPLSPRTKSPSPPIDAASPPQPSKRGRRGAVDAKAGKDASPETKSKEKLTTRGTRSSKKTEGRRDSSLEPRKPGKSSSESDTSSLASQDEEVPSQPDTNESPLRKLPPRNAAKFEKGWITSLRRSRNSKEYDGSLLNSPDKSKPQDGQAAIDKSSSKEVAGIGKEKDGSQCSVKSKKVADKAPTYSDEERDLVPELRKAHEKVVGRRKTRLGRSSQDATASKSFGADTQKFGASDAPVAELKHRGLKDFESRITAKLGIDMNAPVSSAVPKKTEKPPKKPADRTSQRTLRKRGGGKKIKYAEAEDIEQDKSPVKTQPHVKDVKTSSASAEKSLSASVNENEKSSSPSGEKMDKNVKPIENGLKPATSTALCEPKPGCSWYPDATPLRPSGPSKTHDKTKKTPLVPPSSSLFSIFKKPETPRRSSLENKIFLSSAKSGEVETEKKQLPVYGNPNMTPLKKTSELSHDKKEELYDFDEVDENEPKPKKRHKPIMKIQRVRAVKRKKPKVYEADPETERRVLRYLDLSPSVLQEVRSAKTRKVENAAGVVTAQPSPPAPGAETSKNAAVVAAQPSASASHAETSNNTVVVVAAQPSSSAHLTETPNPGKHHDMETSDHHDYDLPVEPMSSPCRDYGQSTPMRDDAPSMFMDDRRDKFGRLSAKVYSPMKSKDSPIPVLMAEYNNDPVRTGESSRRSIVSYASGVSGASGNSIYHDDLDVSASTPVKFNQNDSTYPRQNRKPLEFDLSNCFGFDEPEIVEEPLVSPIKSTVPVPATPAPPVKPLPILKSKPPVMLPPRVIPAVDVDQVIKQLRFEVGDNSSADNSANISVYDDTEIPLKLKSPIKKYFQPKDDHKRKASSSAEESTLAEEESDESFSPVKSPKVPRLSYERPSKLRKKKAVEPDYDETSEPESTQTLDSDTEHDLEHAEEVFRPTLIPGKKETPKKRGMTKKEEEELEKWAQMFNSQCNEIDRFGLVLE